MLIRQWFRSISLLITWRRFGNWLWTIWKLLALILLVSGIVVFVLIFESFLTDTHINSVRDLIQALGDSSILGALESIAIVTGVILFVISGNKQERQQTNYLAWIVIDIAGKKQTSYARYQALIELNKDRVPLNNLDLENAYLERIELNNAELNFSCFKNANLKNASLNMATFWNAELENANLESAILKGADFYCAKAHKTKFCRGRMKDSNFRQAILSGSDFSSAELENVDFSSANLKNANFSSADLRNAVFDNTDLESAIFDKSKIGSANFRTAINIPYQQILTAEGWESASFSYEARVELNLLHNAQRN